MSGRNGELCDAGLCHCHPVMIVRLLFSIPIHLAFDCVKEAVRFGCTMLSLPPFARLEQNLYKEKLSLSIRT